MWLWDTTCVTLKYEKTALLARTLAQIVETE